MSVRGKRIFVGLSGGVDSAVTAALLKQQGATVEGVFIKGWYPEGLPCTWQEDRRDAMRVAAALHIPFATLDAGEAYKTSVLDYLIREYKAGRTPNPDIMCNRDVKFGVFYRYAKERGADGIATGHYARTEGGKLFRGVDSRKDQSYFLWAVPKTVLTFTHFPLGSLTKEYVRVLGAKLRLPVADKKDSQGICFLGPVSIDEFLERECTVTEGVAYTAGREVLGRHRGALLYTLGERVALSDAPPGPWYVLEKHLDTNELVVSKTRTAATSSTPMHIEETNWFREELPTMCEAQYRYHGPCIPGTFIKETNIFTPSDSLTEPAASGQSLVLYKGDECFGGGIIR